MNYKELNSEEGTREDLEECRDHNPITISYAK